MSEEALWRPNRRRSFRKTPEKEVHLRDDDSMADVNRGTSPTGKRLPPWDPPRTLGIGSR